MDKNVIVEIFVPEQGAGGQEGGIATGYPIAKNLILTARHVLYPDAGRDEAYPIEVRWRHPEVRDRGWQPLKIPSGQTISWQSEQWDLALLECELPPGIQNWGFLSEQKPKSHTLWESVGFPAVAGKKNAIRNPFDMQGTVFSMLDTAERFDLEATAGPKDGTDWKGASGSPVFVNWRILGVIVSVPGKLEAARLRAAPIWRLLREDDEFRKIIGHDRRQDRQKHVKRRLAAVLQPVPNGMECLAESMGEQFPALVDDMRGKDAQRKAEYLAEWVLRLEVGDAVKALRKAYEDMRDRPSEARVLVAALNIILPAVYDHGIVETVRNVRGEANAALVTLPVHYPTVAEIIMAGADRRETLFCDREYEAHFPKGKLCLPEPPESGFDSDGQRAMEALEQHLGAKFCPARADEFEQVVDDFIVSRFYRAQPGAPERTWEQKLSGAAREIRYRAEDEGKTHYLMMAEPEDREDRQALENVLRRIHQRFPGLMCLSLKQLPEMEADEFESFRRLLGMLPIR